MSRPHQEFEMLTAFAAINQLSDHDGKALNEHLESCASCRLQLVQMKAASYAYFAHHCARSGNKDLSAEVSERFSRKLARLGISPGSRSIANPARSLRVATTIVAFAVLAPMIAGVLAKRHHSGSSEQAEIVVRQSVPESPAVVSRVLDASRRPEARARRRRPRRSGPMKEHPSQARELYLAGEHLPYFRLEYPEMLPRRYPEPFAVPSVPSFPLLGLGKPSNGAKIFELASLPAPGQSNDANALRFIPPNDLTHPGNISGPAQFHLPPLTGDLALFTDMRH